MTKYKSNLITQTCDKIIREFQDSYNHNELELKVAELNNKLIKIHNKEQ